MPASRTAICPTCTSVVADGDRFCKQCGTVVSGISAAIGISSGGEWAPTPTPEQAPSPVLAAGSPWEAVLVRLREVTAGEFEVGRELGRGGMAAVFLGNDLALNRRVAIKVMAPGLMMGDDMVQRFRREAITIANLQHANIVTVHAVRQMQDLHFFVMQFVEGQSLDGVLRDSPQLPLSIVRPILHQVGSALAYAHRRGVVHRDIKPGNILLSGDGDALVTDFGIAKVAEGPSQTQTGMVVGTPSYMSPEQCFASELDGASDQYSLGVVAYQMLTGRVPFSGGAFEIMKGHTTDPVPSMREFVPDIPEAVEQAVLRMMAKKPADRFPSFGDALAAMGAQPLGEDGPLRAEMIRLAAVEERRHALGDLLRTPMPTPGVVASPPTPLPAGRPSPAALSATVVFSGQDGAPAGPPTPYATPTPSPTPSTAPSPAATPSRGRPTWLLGVAVVPIALAAWFLTKGGSGAVAGRADSVAAVPLTASAPTVAPSPPSDAGRTSAARDVNAPPTPAAPATGAVPSVSTAAPASAPPPSATPATTTPATATSATGGNAAAVPRVASPTVAPSKGADAASAPAPASVTPAPAASAPPPPSAVASSAPSVSQAQLATEARALVETIVQSIESRDLARLRSIPGISGKFASAYSDLFANSRAIRVTVKSVNVANGGSYDGTPGARTAMSAAVEFRVTPTRGSASAPYKDELPLIMQRDATGWRLVQVGEP